jgi:hypothetical protein
MIDITAKQKSQTAQDIITHISGLLQVVSSDPYAVEDPSIQKMLRSMSSGLLLASTWRISTLAQLIKKKAEIKNWTIEVNPKKIGI